jgi:DNA primase
MSRIPDAFIDELLARVDIVDVVGARVPLKRAGREHQACCPFHDEKTPSFTVSPSKQFYHCFGCGAHGNAIGFLMEYDNLGFLDSVEELARQAGMEVPKEAGQRREGGEALYEMLVKASSFFQRQLPQTPAAVDYLKDRGISGEIARDFQIGYAPDSWDGLLSALGPNKEAIALLDRAGLLSTRDSGGHYDKFRGRIIFPILDTRGRPVAFGGRVMSSDGGPKYLNSPETELFHKGRQLYGLYQARQAVGKLAHLIVVEGYMDVVALAQFGIREVVATLGTATTPEHAEILFRAAPEVIFCFDGDRAGRQAAERALESVLPRLKDGRQARFLFLPDGEDPDSLVRSEGREAFEGRVSRATPFSDFFFSGYEAEVDMTSLDGRARLVELSRPRLEHMPDGALRDMMFERLAKLARTQTVPTPKSPRQSAGRTALKRTLVRSAIGLLLQRPTLAGRVTDLDELAGLEVAGMGLLVEMIEICQKRPTLNTGSLLEHWRGRSEEIHLAKLAGLSLLADNHDLESEFDDAIGALKRQSCRQRCEQLQQKQAVEGLSDLEKEELRRLLALRASWDDSSRI